MLLGIAHTACLHNLTEAHGIVLRVRRFDADGGFSGNRRFDAHTGRSQTQGNIIRKVHHRAYLHACRRLQLKAGNRRSARYGNNSGAHLEICQGLLQHRTLVHDVLLIGGRVAGLRRIQKLQRGQLIAARCLRFRLICCCGLRSRRRCGNFICAVKNRYGRLLRFRLRPRLCLGRLSKLCRLLLAIGIADDGSRTLRLRLRLRFGSRRLGIIQKAAVRLVIIVIIDNRSYNDLRLGLLPFGQLHRVTLYFLFQRRFFVNALVFRKAQNTFEGTFLLHALVEGVKLGAGIVADNVIRRSGMLLRRGTLALEHSLRRNLRTLVLLPHLFVGAHQRNLIGGQIILPQLPPFAQRQHQAQQPQPA